MRSDHELLEDAVAAFVLGAGEPGEADMVRTHLEACASCLELAARLNRAVAALPLAAEEVSPPARLRERILAAAAGTAPSTPDFSRNQTVRRSQRPRFLAKSGMRGLNWAPLAAAAALVIALGAGIGIGHAIVPAPSLVAAHHSLAGTGALRGTTASVVDFRGAGTTLVEFHGLPAAAPGKVYELWLIPSGAKPVPAGVFVPDQDGSKVLVLSRGLAGYKVMAVTIETGPDGAVQPTQQPELSGSV